jgi:hypothetical protein
MGYSFGLQDEASIRILSQTKDKRSRNTTDYRVGAFADIPRLPVEWAAFDERYLMI